MRCFILLLSSFLVLLSSCQPTRTLPETPTVISSPAATRSVTPAPTITATSTLQTTSLPLSLGPDADDFPAPLNPLTGLEVEDPSLLKIPAQLISISHFPATARPQAGLSFANVVWEISITEGASRFLSVFYGQYPEPEIPVTGDCDVRAEPLVQTRLMLGNRVWWDENENGRADAWEKGVGGVCVHLLDSVTEKILQETTTDSMGYYGFNVETGEYVVEFVRPLMYVFTRSNMGDDSYDSDAVGEDWEGRSEIIKVSSDTMTVDAGLVYFPILPDPNYGISTPVVPKAQVGPVRSGRLVYADIAAFYPDSCLIFAFASEEVLEQLPQCAMVTHDIQGGGYMLDIERLKFVAEDNARKTADKSFNYASNLFSENPPEGGLPAMKVTEYWAYLNQSGWLYDAASRAWWRTVDDSTKANAGIQHLETDRLTGRQLQFENIIVIFAEVDVISPTNLDIHLEQGDGGPAILFRDGMKYDIRWSTKSTEFEKRTAQRTPMHFLNLEGSPAALKPGHTWVIVLTPWSLVEERGDGNWFLQYLRPEGEK
jgi:hypothetical protein